MSGKKVLLIKCVVFLLIFAVLFYTSQEILTNKWDFHSTKYTVYPQEPAGSLDVLFIGSSPFWAGLNPMILWEECGFTSYNLSTNSNTPFLNYQQLLLGLETQTPKVIVTDFNSLCQERKASSSEYEYTFRYVHDSLPSWRKKFAFDRALHEADPEVNILSFYFPLLCYHTRWDELVEADFVGGRDGYQSYAKGSLFNLAKRDNIIFAPPEEELFKNAVPQPVSDYSWTFYQGMIDLCREKGITLVLLTCPENLIEDDVNRLGFYKTIKATCENLHLDYYNCNTPEFWETYGFSKEDFFDRGHFNWHGSVKFSAAIAPILQRDFDLPDHRGDPVYSSWEKDWNDFYQDHNLQLSEFGY